MKLNRQRGKVLLSFLPTLVGGYLAGCSLEDTGASDREAAVDTGDLAFKGGSSGKVDICHQEDSSGNYHVINVSTSAVDQHFANHGDSYPGTYYPDADGDGFGDPDGATDPCPNPGFVADDTDCDDSAAGTNPGAAEIAYDGIDQDCSGADLTDVDGDGYDGGANGTDCDDADAGINPGAAEIAYDGIDQDCSGADLTDVDGDGYDGGASGTDCDDADPALNPGATEVCGDAIDNNCNLEVDEGCLPPLPSNCTDGTYEGHYYQICQGSLTRPEAVDACTAQGMSLVHIDTEGENTFVVDTAQAAFGCVSYDTTSYWISNLKSETSSTWPSGNPIWAGGEPNGDGGYVHIMRYCSQPYGWNDVPDSYRWGWVCELAL